MIKNELKSILRNKNNFIYLIVIIILFIILNISLNIKFVIAEYYDNKINEYIKSVYEQYKQEFNEEIQDIKLEELIRTIQTTDGRELAEEQKQKINKMKHVENVKSKVIELSSTSVTINYILVDDWKNCSKIQYYLDSQGIESYVDTISIDKKLLDNYKLINNFSNIMVYLVVAITIIILMICYTNIVINEYKNLNLLNVVGYKKNKIKYILFCQLMILSLIGVTIGYILYKLLFFTFINNILGLSIKLNVINNIIINLIIIVIPILVSVGKARIGEKYE